MKRIKASWFLAVIVGHFLVKYVYINIKLMWVSHTREILLVIKLFTVAEVFSYYYQYFCSGCQLSASATTKVTHFPCSLFHPYPRWKVRLLNVWVFFFWKYLTSQRLKYYFPGQKNVSICWSFFFLKHSPYDNFNSKLITNINSSPLLPYLFSTQVCKT